MAKKTTPMMEQYLAIKKQYPDAFLFYRLGDFYEMFYDDAVKGAQLLELTLTARNKQSKEKVPMCGVPHHAVQNYIDILVDQGYKVAICEQMEDPKLAKGMVKREVVQLITPGTLVDQTETNAKDNNYLTALHESQEAFGLAYVDLSTGELQVTHLSDLSAVVNELISLQTKEVVLDESVTAATKKQLKKLHILQSPQLQVSDHAEVGFAIQGLTDPNELAAVKHLVSYLIVTQKRALTHLKRAVSYTPTAFLKLDHSAVTNLDLVKNSRTGKKAGTLLWLLDKTKTAMGGRMLHQWIRRPLLDAAAIRDRQERVTVLLENFMERSALQEELTHVYDLERLVGRVALGNVNGRDLVQLRTSLEHIPQLRHVVTELDTGAFTTLLKDLDPVSDVTDLIHRAIVDDPPVTITDGGLIRPGYSKQLDEYTEAMTNGKQWIADLEQQEREATGINKLKIGFNRVFGYYIEVSRAHLDKVPQDRYHRKQTLVNAERFITPELKEKEQLILGAEDHAVALEHQLFMEIREQIKRAIPRLQRLAAAVAQLDVLQSFATVSEEGQFVRPTFDTQHQEMVIEQGWHPVIAKVIGTEEYVPNDVQLTRDAQILLITGPNMSGKSTYMRQVALTVIMAQMGCYVPAKKAQLPLFDQIFTRIGAADDLIAGNSTFMVEMQEANAALSNATANSLLLFDELGRGTATYDGMALAQAIIEYVHEHVHAKTLFSTHYHELTQLTAQLPRLKNVHVGAVERDGKLIFLHKVAPGPADKSYGIHVAKLAGMPAPLIKRANVILQQLEATADSKPADPVAAMDEQLSLFVPETPPAPRPQKDPVTAPIVAELRQLNLMGMTPLDAMNLLYKWQQQLQGGGVDDKNS